MVTGRVGTRERRAWKLEESRVEDNADPVGRSGAESGGGSG